MLELINYDRERAVSYANEWAYRRNPNYLDFRGLGGDCTNFVSQCIYAGCGVMNYTPIYGWYYISAEERTPSWTGVKYLYQFLIDNLSQGPFAKHVPIEEILPGDIIQLGNEKNEFYHTLVVVKTGASPAFDNILIASHSFDANRRPLNTYQFKSVRFLHIGARTRK